jgi:hypothetical protein
MHDRLDQLEPLTRRDATTAVAIAALVLLAGSLRMAPGVCGSFHDDAIYVSTAQALADGAGYRLIGVPGEPPQTKYPFLYPAVLAVVWRMAPAFPANLVVMQWLTLSFGACAVALTYLYLVRFRYCTRAVAAAAGVVCATAPYFLYFAVQTMAEMLFALCTIAALWGVEAMLLKDETSRRKEFAWGVALALPFWCRTIGATVAVAGLGVLIVHRRPWRWYISGAACGALPWILWSLAGRGIWNQDPVNGYYTDYFGCWSSTGLAMVGTVLSRNILLSAHGSAELPLEGVSTAIGHVIGRENAMLLVLAVGLVPWLAMIPDLRRGRALPWMLAATLAALLVWSWPPYRFLVPVLPFLTAYLLLAPVALLTAARMSPYGRAVAALVVSAIVAANGVLFVKHAQLVSRTGYIYARLTDSPVEWSSYQDVFRWLRAHAQSDDVIAAGLDSMISLYTDRKSFRPFVYNPGRLFYSDGPPELLSRQELVTILRQYQPRYLVETPMPGFMEQHPLTDLLHEVAEAYPAWLPVAYRGADRRFVVYEIDWRHAPSASGIQLPGDLSATRADLRYRSSTRHQAAQAAKP